MQYRRAVLSQTTPAVRPGTRHGMYPLGIATEQPWLEQRLRNGLIHLDNIANRRDAATTLLAATGKLCKPMYALGESQLQREIADIRRALNSGVYNREIHPSMFCYYSGTSQAPAWHRTLRCTIVRWLSNTAGPDSRDGHW